jgi:4-hydroxybenzoate polyprenyltransferase
MHTVLAHNLEHQSVVEPCELGPSDRLIPVIVDVDGTLILTDLLYETFFRTMGVRPLSIIDLLRSLSQGKARLKAALANLTTVEPATLPYDPQVRAIIDRAKMQGRKVYLASAGNDGLIEKIAHYVGADGWFASSDAENLSGIRKANLLIREFGDRNFDYVGNSSSDLAVWMHARKAIVAGGSARIASELKRQNVAAELLACTRPGLRDWLRLLRLHQYVKNLLVFLPPLAAHALHFDTLVRSTIAFIAFCLCASAVYIENDLIDIKADRAHPTKKNRPLASGRIKPQQAIVAAPILLAASFALGLSLSVRFAAVLAIYLLLTSAYSLFIKRKMIADVVTLALLYSIRVVGGAVANDLFLSEWLLAFSLFVFTSLALVKRFTELAMHVDNNSRGPSNRNYITSDLPIIAVLACASAFNSITVFTLYISSDAVRSLYVHPETLWLACPILAYWFARLIVLANRHLVADDPIVFAFKDWNSWLVGALILSLMLIASI